MLLLRQIHAQAKPLMHAGLNLLFPPHCPECNARVEEPHSLCALCWQKLHFISEPYCVKCGIPFAFAAETNMLCGGCSIEMPPFKLARSVLHYNAESRPILLQFKYADRTLLARFFARLLLRVIEPIGPVDCIVPVPLHPWRLFFRRYNQAALLAHALSDLTSIAVQPNALARTRPTSPQSGLSRAARIRNVAGAFRVKPKYKNHLRHKHILLIDDVMTTSATIHACTRALLQGGARDVSVATVGRTVLTGDQ